MSRGRKGWPGVEGVGPLMYRVEPFFIFLRYADDLVDFHCSDWTAVVREL